MKKLFFILTICLVLVLTATVLVACKNEDSDEDSDKTYTITYYLNGGTNSSSNPTSYTVESVGDGITLSPATKDTANIITNYKDLGNGNYSVTYDVTGYTFLGWYRESDFINQVTAITISDGDVTLYARWSEKTLNTVTETVNAYTRDGNYLYFGTYPQTEVTDSALKSALTTQAGTLPTEGNRQKWTSYGYYISSSNTTDYMWYIDLAYGGEQYRGVYFTSYRPYSIVYASSASNSYQADNGYTTGNVYWFKYEPIKWRILTESNGEALLFAEMAIDSQEYYHEYRDDSFSHNGGKGYANNYALSNIRKWLNDNFYNTAFNEMQKELIMLTTVDNSARSTSDAGNKLPQATKYACADTQDYVYLLSEQEVTNSAYGFSSDDSAKDSARRRQYTDYAKCQGTSTKDEDYKDNCYWRLRSPIDNCNTTRLVLTNGYASSHLSVDYTFCGIVPALRIKLSDGKTATEGHVHTWGADGFCTKCDEHKPTDGLRYELIGDEYFVTGYNGFSTSIYIPEQYNGLPVTTIYGEKAKSGAFYNQVITDITLPKSIVKIGAYAFDGCKSLINVYYNGDFESWCGIKGLTSLLLLTYNGTRTVYIQGKELKGDVTIPATVKSLQNGVLMGRTGVTSITIEEGVESIGFAAFWGTGITSITLPESVLTIDSFAFCGCESLQTVVLPDSLTSLVGAAFSECTALKSITIGSGLTKLSGDLFTGCTALTSITYHGTKAQWNALKKDLNWDEHTGNYTVHCTDGDIKK
jgi:uncharacterized repeat protein (TIGR02543 family)